VGPSFSVAPDAGPLPGSVINVFRELNAGLGLPQPSNGDPGTAPRRDARNPRPLLGRLPSVESAHPSPMAADRGFFGSRAFSRANDLLIGQGGQPVDRRLP
jgi:uracil-DNA glycosylase